MKTPEKLAERLTLLKKTCDAGESDACYSLASDTLDGDYGVPKDAIEGMQILRRSCKLGDRVGCSDLAEYFFAGKYVAKDPKAGDEILRATCAQGDHFVCRELAEHLLGLYDDSDLPENPVKEIPNARERGRELLAKECQSGGAAAGRTCGLLGRLLVESGDAKGRPMLEKECPKADSTSACGALGWSLFEGKGGSTNKAKGIDLMIKSEMERFVFHAANALLAGKGIAKDAKRGTKVMTGLCTEEHYQPACEVLGIDRAGKKLAKK
jgi:TPR repeat protein